MSRDNQAFDTRILPGLIGWLVFCVAAVLIRGVRWDETFEYAQVITRQVHYPEGHPLFQYARNAFSIQTYGAAAMLALGMGANIICGFRNVLFLMATVIPVYLLTTHITRKAIWGSVAAVFVLEGILLEFDGSYPTTVWPELYSNGHIGTGWALLTVYAVATGRLRLAGFLFGVMPCVHLGQWPPLLALAGLYVLWKLWRGEASALKDALPATLAGFAFCMIFFVVQRQFTVPPPMDGPFFLDEDPWPVWKGYTARFDPHRRFPPGNGHVILAGAILLSALAAWRTKERAVQNTYAWIAVYCGIIGALVWGIMAVHAVMGPNIPFLLIVWMPYRLINHVPPLCIAVMIGLIAAHGREEYGRGNLVVIGMALLALTFGVIHPWLTSLFSETFYARYVAHGDGIAFGLYGLALGAVFKGLPGPKALVSAAVVLLALGVYHQFGAVCVFLGCVIALLAQRVRIFAVPAIRHGPKHAGVIFCFVIVSMLLFHQWQYRQWLPRSAFDLGVAQYLEQQGQPAAVLLGGPEEYMVQARTGHAVMADAATPSLISYLPEIGSAIDRMYTGLYGITFRLPEEGSPPISVSWEVLWSDRTPEEWRRLAETYGFDYVLAATNLNIGLHVAFQAGESILYAVN